MDLITLLNKHKEATEAWKASKTYKVFSNLFESATNQNPAVASCMCVCLGSLYEGEEIFKAQFVFFESCVELIGEHSTTIFAIYWRLIFAFS